MYSLAQNGYTWDEVRRLLGQSRTVSYGFDILDKNDRGIAGFTTTRTQRYNAPVLLRS